jgi:hypothetical protein
MMVRFSAQAGNKAARPWARVFAQLIMSLALLGCPYSGSALSAGEGGALPRPLPLFPTDNWWNVDISGWPVDPASASYIAFINNGGTRRLHPDLGGDVPTGDDPNACYGIPFVVVSHVTVADLVPVQFDYSDESDGVDHTTGRSYPFYPIPPEVATRPHWIEGGDPGNIDQRDSQDRHLLIVDSDRNYLYELYNVFFDSSRRLWQAGSGAFFDMNTNRRRPDGWTSADAAGLAILPGLLRFDEVYDSDQVDLGHAFRVTVRATDGYVYPASHRAGARSGALPMGARLRLKASVDVTQRTQDLAMQKIFRAMQKHGLIVADNGSDMYVTGTYDPRWDNEVLNPAFARLTAADFEVIQLGYNPPPRTPPTAVHHLRATLVEKTLTLAWDKETSAYKYRIQTANPIDSPDWRSVADVGLNAWSGLVNPAVGAQFFRVVLLAD